MSKLNDTYAANLLYRIAENRDEPQFVSLCVKALAGEAWAIDRLNAAVTRVYQLRQERKWFFDDMRIEMEVIRSTETTP